MCKIRLELSGETASYLLALARKERERTAANYEAVLNTENPHIATYREIAIQAGQVCIRLNYALCEAYEGDVYEDADKSN